MSDTITRGGTAPGERAADAGAERPRATHQVIIVGAGFAGLGMAHAVKTSGEDRFVVLERARDVGGCWRDNTYPGCACDIPSHLYSFSFDLRPDWSRMYPRQAEIWAYLRSVVDKWDLRRHIRFETPLSEARWDDVDGLWHVRAGNEWLRAPFLVMGLGPLNIVSHPDIPGLERFAGARFHSAEWDHSVELTGKRVGVIGTGASSIQFVPHLQAQAAALTLFQRTPPWVVPRMDRAFTRAEHWALRRIPGALPALRGLIYGFHELRALGFIKSKLNLMGGVEAIAKWHMRRAIKDPVLRRKLTPDYRLGCKRVLVSDDYYPALAKSNVAVETARIREIVAEGVVTEDGRLHPLDVLVTATGFAVENPVRSMRITGRNGLDLAARWDRGFEAFKGTMVSGFPNLFYLIGPNTGLGHNSMVYMIESQVRFVMDAMRRVRETGAAAIDVRPEAEAAFNREMQSKSAETVWTTGCASWYLDGSGRNTTLWPGFTFTFRHRLKRADLAEFELIRAA